jgi:transposase-like protein
MQRTFSAEQKAQVVHQHLAGNEPVLKLAEELRIEPGVIDEWINQLLTQAERAFERPAGNGPIELATDRHIEQLQAKIVQKNEGIAELMADNSRQNQGAREH